jgi:hypothetical protein
MTTDRGADSARLSDAQIAQVMELLKGVNSVELKLTIPASGHRATITGLPLDPVEAEPRQVFFFDTPNLDLYKAGVVARARRIQGGRADTVVKLRPVVPENLDAKVRRSSEFNVELDVLPGGFVCSASFKGESTGEKVRAVVDGTAPLAKVFSKDQRAFYSQNAPEGIGMDSLRTLGPTFVLKSRFLAKELKRKVVAEVWLYPDGSRLLELSTKCVPNEAFQVAAEFRAYLAKRGIETGGSQQTKTRDALDFFSAELRGGGAGPAE